MFRLIILLTLFIFSAAVPVAATNDTPQNNACPATLDFTLRQLDSEQQVNLCEAYQDKMLLIVNTASHCGFTPQFAGLEKIYQQYKARGFVVLGMPSNDFGSQDPGDEKAIASVCNGEYQVTFPMFSKLHAAEPSASPLYKTLGELAGEYPKWNFHKYLVFKGELIASFPSHVTPEDKQIVSMLDDFLPK